MTATPPVAWDTGNQGVERFRFTAALEEARDRGKQGFVQGIAEQPGPSTERNRRRREAFFSTPFSICIERARWFTE